MGYQRAWAYETVLELVFEKGKLIHTEDHSERMREIRKIIEKDKKKFEQELHKNVHQLIENSFSLDLKTKCWWLSK